MTTPASPGSDRDPDEHDEHDEHGALLDRLGLELADVVSSVERIRSQLVALRPPPEAPPTAAWAPPGRWVPGPTGPGRSGAPAPAAPATPPPRPVPATREGLGARLLATTGAAVTLLGVVLLLVLAARSGWFGPGSRVLAGAGLGVALTVTGLRMGARHATGAVALVATGVAALYLDVAAATTLYTYLAVPLGLLTGLLVLGGGLAVADRWRSPGLATGAVVGLAALVPVVAHRSPAGVVALLVVAQVLAAVLGWRRGWSVPVVVATVAGALAALVGAVRLAVDGAALAPLTTGALAVLAVAVALAAAGAARLPAASRVALAVVALPPVLLAAGLHERWDGVAVTGAVTLVLLGTGRWVRHRASRPEPLLAVVLEAAGGIAGFTATVLAFDGFAVTAVLLGQATVLTVVSLAGRRRGPLVAAVAYGLVGLAVTLADVVPVAAVTAFGDPTFLTPGLGRDVPALVSAVVTSLLLSAAAVAVLAALARGGLLATRGTAGVAAAALGTVALYGAAGTVVALALLVSPTRSGFLTGHVLLTVSWTAVALVLLVRGLRDSTSRVLGGVLVVAAVAKLVLFDLTALEGLARVAAFLGAGLVLLGAGTRYASALADSGTDPETRADQVLT